MAAMRADEVKPLQPLRDEQLRASDPAGDVWLSASAGTGKTHVLTARVLRLLLRPGLDPSTILCLTFTKAGAAEMAERVQSRLARWVRLDEPSLKKELFSLGETHDDPAVIQRARTLFARVLEVPGGLRIGTIHAFAGSLLASFPLEAGLLPGFRPMEGREEALLARQTLAEMVLAAERAGDDALIEALGALGLRLGEGGAEAWLRRCAQAGDVMEALPDDIRAFVGQSMELPSGEVADAIAAACARHPFDGPALERIGKANRAWATATGTKHADAIDRWHASEHHERGGLIGTIRAIVHTAEGAMRKASAKLLAHEPDYEAIASELGDACSRLDAMREQAALADLLSAGLEAGRRYARAYADAKRSAGLVDFNDLIARVGRLLEDPTIGAWIRYMLDQATDHILVDEGQDTNARQWAIVNALAAEYFTGAGARGGRVRTLFTVGDHKQAIFGFQGTDPLFFRAAEERFAALAAGLVPEDAGKGPMARLSLSRSFRSAPPVLDVVDALIEEVGSEALGLFDAPPPHESAVGGPGAVELWPPVGPDDDEDARGADEEGWIDDATRRFATRLAEQIADWLRDGLWLAGKGRPIEAQDIMILVRRRGDLASLLVARLHAAKVPVAGVDRLRLSQPLAVQDLLAAARFAVQPDDSLTLAALLVSPLIGWDQDRLGRAAMRPAGVSLWRHLRDGEVPDALGEILAMADLVTPYAFFERILSGPMQGRRRLLGRLGAEAADPIDELLNAALQFERTGTPGLQRFLDWFDRDDVEIVRDPSAPLDVVRVMTVHGAKGLQAPVVILADATVDPERSPRRELLWQASDLLDPLPVFRPRKAELAGSLLRDAEQADRRDRQEHWRLLYVAATRAEERLVIAGALGPAARGVPPAASWYSALSRALGRLGAPTHEDERWGAVVSHRIDPPARRSSAAKGATATASVVRPDWIDRPAPEEARPSRPLSPSAPSEDDTPNPPPSAAMQAAAERGRLLHALFERLPDVPQADRRARADAWLSGAGGVDDAGARAALIDDALAVVEAPGFAELFGPDALAEAPLAAVVAGMVVAGTVDRLLVSPERVLVVDFKTGRRVPQGLAQVPDSHLRQMAAYVAALRTIFPDRPVDAALLYTSGPRLIELDEAIADRFHPARLSEAGRLPT